MAIGKREKVKRGGNSDLDQFFYREMYVSFSRTVVVFRDWLIDCEAGFAAQFSFYVNNNKKRIALFCSALAPFVGVFFIVSNQALVVR